MGNAAYSDAEDADATEYGTIRFLYNGQLGVVTDDNGLYYMRARYYNPNIKRFINQDILTGNIGNSASLNRYSYVEGNPVSYTDPFGLSPFDYFTDKINVSSIIHSTLDILGTLPSGGIFDIMNAGYYLLEGNYKEAFKSIVFAIPGFDLMKTSSKLAVKGGRLSSAAAEVLSTLNTMDMLACVYYAASDFGNDMAHIIYKYGIEKADFSEETWVEMLSLTAHGIQLGHYSNPFMDTDLTPYFEEALSELNQNKGFINFGSGESDSGNNFEPLKGDAADQAASELGYTKIGERSHGQPVYKRGNKYITPDVDGHNGGVWKMANSPKNLKSKHTRLGTFDGNLNRIGD